MIHNTGEVLGRSELRVTMHTFAETIFQDLCELGQFLAQTSGFNDEFPLIFWFFRFAANFEQL